jgi:hypothetical protein
VKVETRTPDTAATAPAQLLSLALQRGLAAVEQEVAERARAAHSSTVHSSAVHSSAEHSSAEHSSADDLLVVDGPLHERRQLPRAIGFVKSHRSEYLRAAELVGVVAALRAGQRTPVFGVGSRYEVYTWYLRLPCARGAPWSGVVRVECSAELPAAAAAALAATSQVTLGRFAAAEYKDSRAPQNLYPIAGLERLLRRRLAHPGAAVPGAAPRRRGVRPARHRRLTYLPASVRADHQRPRPAG